MSAHELPYWDSFRDTAMGKYLLDREQAFLIRAWPTRPRRVAFWR